MVEPTADRRAADRHAQGRTAWCVGEADHVDLQNRWVGFTEAEGEKDRLAYDRLVLAVGSVNKLLPIPGVTEYAHGFRGLPEARLPARPHRPADRAGRAGRGPGRAAGPLPRSWWSARATPAPRSPRTGSCSPTRCTPSGPGSTVRPRWMLLDVAPPGAAGAGQADVADRAPGARPARRRRADGHLGGRGDLPTGCSSPTASTCRPARWCGASGCAPTRSSTSWACGPSRAGWSSTSTSTCPAIRRCSPAVTPPRCRT